MKSRDKVLKLITEKDQSTAHLLAVSTGFSRQYIHRILNELEAENQIIKTGIPPSVFYSIAKKSSSDEQVLDYQKEQFLKQHFLIIDPLGNQLEGLNGFKYWCDKQHLPLLKTIDEYMATRQKYLDLYNNAELLDGLHKLQNTKGIDKVGVDALYYLDFYAIERFGKTRLGTLMHYAKQGQNKMLMAKIVEEIRQRILNLIHNTQVDAILYVPHTIQRKVQIMDYLQKHLAINLPKIEVKKIKTQIIVPQKALSKIFERVENARNTFFVPEQKSYQHILILDDAVGSGATINEIALRLKEKNLTQKITGLSITGSYKGFEVLSEL